MLTVRRWESKLSGEIERALVRTLRRQPTRRADIYDWFVSLWLEREIKRAAGQRGSMSPEKLRLEVRERMVKVQRSFLSAHVRSLLALLSLGFHS